MSILIELQVQSSLSHTYGSHLPSLCTSYHHRSGKEDEQEENRRIRRRAPADSSVHVLQLQPMRALLDLRSCS